MLYLKPNYIEYNSRYFNLNKISKLLIEIIKITLLILVVYLVFECFYLFHHSSNPFKSWHEFSVSFLSWWCIWLTEWITTLNLFVSVSFILISMIKIVKIFKGTDFSYKFKKRYLYWKWFNTTYMLYMFIIYNSLLLFHPSFITDYDKNKPFHTSLNSVYEHMLIPVIWFTLLFLDKDVYLKINNPKESFKIITVNSLTILTFLTIYVIFSETRTYLIHINVWQKIWHGAALIDGYKQLNPYKTGYMVFIYIMAGLIIFFILASSYFLYSNRKNNTILLSSWNKTVLLAKKVNKISLRRN